MQAESSSLGSVVGQKIVDTIPWKGHSSLFLYMAAPGVVGNRYWEDTRPSDTGTNVLFTANGSPPATGEVSVDGVSNTVNVGRGLFLSPWVPSMDGVAEVKLLMGTLPAEYGRGRRHVHQYRDQVGNQRRCTARLTSFSAIRRWMPISSTSAAWARSRLPTR